MEVKDSNHKTNSEYQIESKHDNPPISSTANMIYTKKQLNSKSGLTPDKKKTEPNKSQHHSVEKDDRRITTKGSDEISSSKKKFPIRNPKAALLNPKVIETYKVSSESEKERRAYEEKVQAMQNRLNALKKQENDIQRKMRMFNTKEKELDQVKGQKEAFKNALNSFKCERQRIIEEQKRRNEEEKLRLTSAVENSIKENRIKKHADFDLARNEKQIIVSLISENNEQLGDYNQRKINQIKTELENYREQELRKQNERDEQMIQYYLEKRERDGKETSRLKHQMAQLEKLEEQYLESLQTTQNAQRSNSSFMKHSFVKGVNANANANVNMNNQKNGENGEMSSVKKIQFDSNQKDKKQVRSQSTCQNRNAINVNKPEGSMTKDNISVGKRVGNTNNSKKIVIDRKR